MQHRELKLYKAYINSEFVDLDLYYGKVKLGRLYLNGGKLSHLMEENLLQMTNFTENCVDEKK